MTRGWRVHWGRQTVWQEAFVELKRGRALYLKSLGGLLLVLIVINLLPRVPPYERGLLTGVLVTAYVALVCWGVWVLGGLAYRMNGLWAEESTSELLDGAPGVHAVIPNLGYAQYDIDHVVVCGAGVVAVETKWHSTKAAMNLARDADQAGKVARTLRLNLKRNYIPEELFAAALVVWGPAALNLEPHELQTGYGPVTVVPGQKAGTWLAELRRGPVGPDFASTLADEVEQLARARQAARPERPGVIMQWLTRVR